ncbi:MAG: prolyl oligopeptidase family serine peptidase [Bdellovibrionales bacterium]
MFLWSLLFWLASVQAQGVSPGTYPATPQRPVTEVVHGYTVIDPFRWLENGANSEVQDWSEREHEFSMQYLLSHYPEAQTRISARLRELFLRDEDGVPARYGSRLFFHRRYKDRDGYDVVMRPEGSTVETVLLNSTDYSRRKQSLKGFDVSPHGNYVTYVVSTTNGDYGDLYLIELETGRHHAVIGGVRQAEVSWLREESGFYVKSDPIDRFAEAQEAAAHSRTFFVRPNDVIESLRAAAVPMERGQMVIRNSGNPSRMADGWLDHESSLFFVGLSSFSSSVRTVFVKRYDPAQPPAAELDTERLDRHGLHELYTFDYKNSNFREAYGSDFAVSVGRPDRENDQNVYIWSVAEPDPEKWKILIPASDKYIHTSIAVIGRHILVSAKSAGSEFVFHYDLQGTRLNTFRDAEFGETQLTDEDEEHELAVLSSTTPLDPGTHYQVNLNTGERRTVKRSSIGFDSTRFRVDRVGFTSKDGAHADIVVLRRQDLRLDGRAKAVMSVYGGFNDGQSTGFQGFLVPLLEQGMVVAYPFIRGGNEYGTPWHQAALREKKQNTFNDVMAAAESLIAAGYSSKGKVSLWGGSNGGLTVSATILQRPDLFGASVAAVPLADMLRYHLSGAGKFWISEYGDPDLKEDYDFIAKYSPYQNVPDSIALPPLLIQTADFDDRVDPFHARKLTARLQAAQSSSNPILFQLQHHAGHGASGSLLENIEVWAWQLAFMWRESL